MIPNPLNRPPSPDAQERDLWWAAMGVVCAIVGAACILVGACLGVGRLIEVLAP